MRKAAPPGAAFLASPDFHRRFKAEKPLWRKVSVPVGGPSPRSLMTPIRCHPHASHLVRVAARPAGIGLDFARWCLSSHHDVDDDERTWAVLTSAGTLRLGGPFRR